jgi:hypothetical protein
MPILGRRPSEADSYLCLGSERVLIVGACVVPAFYETPEISARFSQAVIVLLEASTPPYAVVHPV